MEVEVDDLLANGAKFGYPPSDIWVYSTRWVYTWKPPPDDKAKATSRLVIRGFEEKWLQDAEGEAPATDSPTLQRESLRLISMTAAQYCWPLQSWDIRQAFPQADTRYDPEAPAGEHLWCWPPSDFPAKYRLKPGMAMCVAQNHTHYGMASAPRRFYFFLRGILLENGFQISKYDECVFLFFGKNGKLSGICGFHVDDGLLTGDEKFWSVMEEVSKRVLFGKRQKKQFVFCGVRITQLSDFSVELDQESAIDIIEPIPIVTGRSDADPLTPTEVTHLRGRLGSILYITGNTRPFEAYSVSHISAYTNIAKVEHLRQVNLVIKHLKATKMFRLKYVKIQGPLVCFTFGDSNFKQERDSGSQTGSITFLGSVPDSAGWIYLNLLRWSSRRTRRVVHSTLAAETLAATFSLDMNEGTRGRLAELLLTTEGVLLSDCNSLFEHLYSMTAKLDEMIVPDFHQLREASMPWRHAHSPNFDGKTIEFWWVPTYLMLADNLTKVRTPSVTFFDVLASNSFCLYEFKRPRKAHQSLQSFWISFATFYDAENIRGHGSA